MSDAPIKQVATLLNESSENPDEFSKSTEVNEAIKSILGPWNHGQNDFTFFEGNNTYASLQNVDHTFAPFLLTSEDDGTSKGRSSMTMPNNSRTPRTCIGNETSSTAAQLNPFIKLIVDPKIPQDAKVGVIATIDSLLTSKMANIQDLAREDFIREMGHLMSKAENHSVSTLKSMLTIIKCLTLDCPESKPFIRNYCQSSLQKLSDRYTIVNAARSLLNQL